MSSASVTLACTRVTGHGGAWRFALGGSDLRDDHHLAVDVAPNDFAGVVHVLDVTVARWDGSRNGLYRW